MCIAGILHVTPRKHWMIYRGPDYSHSRIIWLLANPLTFPFSKLLDQRHTWRLGKGKKLPTGDWRGWEEGGRGAKSYDRRKAWSSIKHTLLSCKPLSLIMSNRNMAALYKYDIMYSCLWFSVVPLEQPEVWQKAGQAGELARLSPTLSCLAQTGQPGAILLPSFQVQ